MRVFQAQKEQERKVWQLNLFRGVDLYNTEAGIAPERSPEAPNMMREKPGAVRKRTGFRTVTDCGSGPVNGVHLLRRPDSEVIRLVHAGTCLYAGGGEELGVLLTDNMRDGRSRSMQADGKLYLLDGATFWVYDGTALKKATEDAYIPTVAVGREPWGGGQFSEPLNLLAAGWTEKFYGTASDKVYYLTRSGLDATPVRVRVMKALGIWTALTEGVEFTVDRAVGRVIFASVQVAGTVGAQNIEITAFKTRDDYVNRIFGCDILTLYGAGGAPDRLFLSGNPSMPNMDFCSAYRDFSYFPDVNSTSLGPSDGVIVGYSVVDDRLVTHRRGGWDGANIVVRTCRAGTEAGGETFPIVGILHGEGACTKDGFAVLGGEQLFLSGRGMYAVPPSDLSGERAGQLRSLYLGGELDGLDDGFALAWRDFCLVSDGGGRVFLLDGLQRTGGQYECYYWTDIPARVLWEEDGALWFGTADGRLCRFHTDVNDPTSYNDDGRAIEAYWDTPDLDGQLFFRNKTFRYVSVRLAAGIVTGVEIFAQVRGLWQKIFDAGERARYLDWSYINFEKFVFSADRTPRTLGGKVKLKKVDKVRFRLKNGKLDEPFGLYCFAAEYTEPGNKYTG